VDTGAIRLKSSAAPEPTEVQERVEIEEPRRGFDYEAFETRLESLWFQRKTFLADGRVEDARLQLEMIRAFCVEEGVQRLEYLAGALVAEAQRYLREGNREQTLTALDFAQAFDPGRPQVHRMRAAAYWKFGNGPLAAGTELLAAVKAAWARSVRELSLFPQLAFVLGLALFGAALVFTIVMLVHHNVPFRHEVEEWVAQFADERWGAVAGWAALALPLLLWFGAGWALVYWLVITFRFMSRTERMAALTVLVLSSLTVPIYNVTVALYGTTANPAVRTTLASVKGEYDPDRIVKLRQLVEAHPDDPVYHFLLAGLYKNGRYFEEAFAEYKEALTLDPNLVAAYINVGNIFYTTGQYAEAVANYGRAVEREPDSFLAYFNMHLAQSESFRFAEAEESLREARRIDSGKVAELLSGSGSWGDRPAVQDAGLVLASVWESAIAGRQPLRLDSSPKNASPLAWSARLINPISVVSLAGVLACLLAALISRRHTTARRCIRCGRPFCHHCKSGREAQEYCSQCVHLFVLGDGLAPGTKSRKLYEVERHERRWRRARKLVSLALPGTAHLLRGKTGWGILLLLLWLATLIALEPSLLVPVGRLAGIALRPELIMVTTQVPRAYDTDALSVGAMLALPAVWAVGNAWRWKRREV
jgi:tetratricopeptide (TPR) repeat protein